MNKYRSKKTIVDGITFDSKREAKRYCELKAMEKAGIITNLCLQVKYELIPAQREEYARYSDKTGKRLKNGVRTLEKSCDYIADFTYLRNGELIVEDTKGMRTKDYVIKRKLMLWVHGIRIKEV